MPPIILNESIVDIWEGQKACTILEDYLDEGLKTEVDGKIILAKVSGPAFFGDGVSRNNRFYPRAVWEKQLASPTIQERLASRTMLGCVGHADHPVNEDDITMGRVSHIVSKAYLQEDNQGIAEFLVLNTPAGRNLYTLMKAGSKLKVSTRAQGKFVEGKEHNGMPVVDENNFIWDTIDFVISPGFIETNPQLQESLKMITEKLQKFEASGSNYPQTTASKNSYSIKETKENEMNEQLIQEFKKQSSFYEDLYKGEKKLREEAEEEVKTIEKEKEKVEDELEECKKQLKAYARLGEAEEISKTLQEYADMGITSPVEAKFLLDSLKEEAEEAIDKEEVEELKKDIEESMELLAKYEELGTPEELKDIKDKAEELVDELEKKEVDECVERLSRKYKMSEKLVRRIVEASEDEEEAEEVIKEECDCEDDDDDDKKDDRRSFRSRRRDSRRSFKKDSFNRFTNRRDRLEGMSDTGTQTSVKDYEDDHNTPNKVNDNDVEAVPHVVDEMLESLLNESATADNSESIMESYRPASIVNQMFS